LVSLAVAHTIQHLTSLRRIAFKFLPGRAALDAGEPSRFRWRATGLQVQEQKKQRSVVEEASKWNKKEE
jgi:hypothetical protein